ncbi:MAG: DNA-directed RNA polymerase subunit beta', partial [Oscillospiraceae bacterium]|nr:DNA-directed RNA polymerase subunit beta' [Oscillospiraceae bacterium]
ALKLHPLNCTAFNADFDGDQMAIHVPMSAEAQAEARILMLSANNLLRPQDGSPVTVPTQDMVLGSYYLTYERERNPEPGRAFASPADVAAALQNGEVDGEDTVWVRDTEHTDRYVPYIRTTAFLAAEAAEKGELPREVLRVFSSDTEARLAYDQCLLDRKKTNTNFIDLATIQNQDALDMHEPILVRRTGVCNGQEITRMIRTTVGRLIFNEQIPQDLGFQDRTDPETCLNPEINFVCGKKGLGQIVERCIDKHGFAISAGVLDVIKAQGYHYSTLASLTVSIYDMSIPPKKYDLIATTEERIMEIERMFKFGLLTNDERYRLVVKEWEATTSQVSDALMENLDQFNPIFIMADSGARGSMAQIRQLAGMRGLLANTAGRTIEIPVKANYREGLNVLEYFISSRGARKGLTDTALRTADSGYLTRRLVDVAQQVIIREEDCGTDDGINVYELSEDGQIIEEFSERIKGRFPAEPIVDPETGEVLFGTDRMLRSSDAKVLEAHGIQSIKVRSVLTCRARQGVCSKCYGINLAVGEQVGMGEAVGIIAAQSIGEPGTQLTLRTFHSGGVAGGDITQGLPRVEELFEARKPKKMAQLAELSGRLSIEQINKGALVNVTITADDGETVTYQLPESGLLAHDGYRVEKGFQLVPGSLYPQDVLRVRGIAALHEYLVMEVLKPYRSQGVDINDKHIEVICRQMMRKVRVEDPGDSELLSGSSIELIEFEDAKAAVQARIDAGETGEDGEALKKPTCTRMLLGITKASLATESWLSAASFQETTKVLTDAAISGKEDHMLGLKENVIIGKLIPAGSGLIQYREEDELEEDDAPEGEDFDSAADPEMEPVSVGVVEE